MNMETREITIRAEQGTSMMAPIKRPVTELTREIIAEAIIIFLRSWQNVSAIIIGSDNIDIRSMMPTSRMVKTMHKAIMTVMMSSMAWVGSPAMRAKSRSKAHVTMVRNFSANRIISIAVYMANMIMSLSVTVSMLPKRNELSSGTYPGVRNTNRMPMAMPTAQITAIAESCLTFMWLLIQLTVSDDPTANRAAIAMGLAPKKYPRPSPPKQACVMPPAMATMRRVMMYVPMIAAAIEIMVTPMMAS